MAKKRGRKKLFGAALAAHMKKLGKRSNPKRKRGKRKSYRKHKNRMRHMVKAHARKGGSVSGYRRKGARVKSHMSNPMAGFGQAGSAALEGLIAGAVILGAIAVTGMAIRQTERWPKLQTGWWNVGAKVLIAVAGTWALYKVRPKLPSWAQKVTPVAAGALYVPASLALLGQVAPGFASQISLAADEADLSAQLEMVPNPNPRSDYLLDARLEAQLEKAAEEDRLGMERDSESSSY